MRVLRIKATAQKVGLGESTIWEKVANGSFPKPIVITGNRKGWVEGELDAYIAQRIAERDAA